MINDTDSYWAYISYSHLDKGACTKLHRFLERFSIPAELKPKLSSAQLSSRYLGPIFRDREDLQSAGSLAEVLQLALDSSSALIVICSPNAAQSSWVNKEIEHFIQSGRGNRVFPFIIAGEPNSGNAQECFPPALRGEGKLSIEPMAADARADGDGWRDARLKVAAGLLDVNFDTLKQRALKTQQKRLLAAIAMTTLIALSTSLLAIFAFNQKKLADIRRSQSEELVSFMLGDLRDRLADLGRLDVLDSVGEQASRYFAMLPPEELNDQALEKQALAIRQIGEVRFSQGALTLATSSFETSLQSWQHLVLRKPDNDNYLFELGQAQFWVGYMQRENSNITAATTFYTDYLSTSSMLAERTPDSPRFKMELLYANSNLGSLATEMGDSASATRFFEEAERIGEQLLTSDPDNQDFQLEQAATISWLGRLAQDDWRLRDAIDYETRSESILGDLAEADAEAFFAIELHADSCHTLSSLYWKLGQIQRASDFINCATKALEGLTQHDPENQKWNGRLLQMRVLELSIKWALGESGEKLYDLVNGEIKAELQRAATPRSIERLNMRFQAALLLGGADFPELLPVSGSKDVELSRDELDAFCYFEAAIHLSKRELPNESVCANTSSSRLSIEAAAWHTLINTGPEMKGNLALIERLEAAEFKQPDYLVWR